MRRRRAEELRQSALRAGNASRPQEAVSSLRRALRLLADDPETTNAELLIRILSGLAFNDAEVRSFAQGLKHLHSAEKLLAHVSDQAVRQDLDGTIRAQHGAMLIRVGRLDDSLRKLDDAVVFGERAREQGLSNEAALGTRLVNRAAAHLMTGNPVLAQRDLTRSIAVAQAGIQDENSNNRDALALIEAKARHNLGSLAWRMGDLPRALHYHEDASRSYRALSPGTLAKVRMDQAEVLLTAGLAEEAATQLDEALPEMRRLHVYQDLAEAEALRAGAALVYGDHVLARQLARSARQRFLRRGSTSWASIAALTGLRAEVAAALSGGRAGRSLVTRALALADELSEQQLVDEASVARLLAVRVLLKRREADEAAKQLDLVPAPRRVTPVDHRMLLRLCRAELAVAREDQTAAFRQARSGLLELGRLRDRMGGLELVCGTAVHGRELGELAVRLVVNSHRTAARRLFTWSERTRAQVYRYEPLPPMDDPMLAQRVQEYRHLSRTVQEAERDGKPSRDLRSKLAPLQREVMRLGWRDGPWGRPRPIAGFAEVAEQLGDRVLVTYVAAGPDLVAVTVADGRARLTRLGAVADATAAATELHADLDALSPDSLPPALASVVSGSAQLRAARLDAQLLRPLAKLLDDRELVVVPTGGLYAVAWGVLPSLRGRPVSVAPSATAWLAAMRTATSREAGHTVLVGGPGLPAARGEVGGLLAHHPDAVLLEAEKATVQSVLGALDGAKLAHLAAHGAHEPENALFSQLELIDGALYAHETSRLPHPPEHVVLAACELALSRIRPGDEALGFAGALLAAGGRTVTAAVTRVGDQAAAIAMADYHRLLAAGAPPATALAEANAVDPLRRPFVCLGASRPGP
ncbi:MAG TPA: CHAT domain-containing protein [Pseudonocardiaceae bacterium]|nr:CHAT domain-containing protein [Pseudonocardiaceae bacterium]